MWTGYDRDGVVHEARRAGDMRPRCKAPLLLRDVTDRRPRESVDCMSCLAAMLEEASSA
jgi:hypothetical protein